LQERPQGTNDLVNMSTCLGELQFKRASARIHQGVDPDATRNSGPTLHGIARLRSTLQTRHRQEGSRREEQDLNEHRYISSERTQGSQHS